MTRAQEFGHLVLVAFLAALLATNLACRSRSTPPPATRTLNLVFAGYPETLDPQRHQEDLTRMVLANFYEGLVAFDSDLQIRPRLAEEWTSPTETTWRFKLRRGVRFHDGHELQAADVRRTFERARALPDARVDADVRAVVDVREIDPWTVELVTDRPRPLLVARLANTPILSRDTGDAAIVTPMGTGPYRFTHADPTQRVITGERFAGYWGKPAAHPHFRIEVLTDEALRAQAALAGADMVTPVPKGALDERGQARGAFRVIQHPSVAVTFLVCRVGALSSGSPSPFRDQRVRRALALAIDREELIQAALQGEGVPAHQLVVSGVHGFVPNLPPLSTDRAEARRLLAAAGYPKGFDSQIFVAQRGGPAGEELRRQLAEVGIRLAVRTQSWPDLYREMVEARAPLALASWTTSTGDSSSVLEPLLHSAKGPEGLGAENTTGYADASIDHDLQAAAHEMNALARSALLARVMGKALADLPFVPLYTPSWTYGVRHDLLFAPRLDLAVTAADLRPRPE